MPSLSMARKRKRAEKEPELVDGDGWISDESSFYGDDDQKAQWESTASRRPLDFKQIAAPRNLNALAYQNIIDAILNPPPPKSEPYNPYEGRVSARQLHESVPTFVDRLPPRRTFIRDIHDAFIYIANPMSEVRSLDRHVSTFKERGERILAEFVKSRDSFKRGELGRKCKELHEAILQAARETNVKDGKWMLFPTAEDLNWAWEVVCNGTVARELGSAAKVSAREGEEEPARSLICVYTKDFDDKIDVKRVIVALQQMGLAQGQQAGFQRAVYYKCDAYTHLGIDSKNKYGLKASMYASTDWLGAARVT